MAHLHVPHPETSMPGGVVVTLDEKVRMRVWGMIGAWWAVVHGIAESWTRLSNFTFTFMHWRRKWQPTPVFLPGESQGRGSLVGCRLWGRTESDTTEET